MGEVMDKVLARLTDIHEKNRSGGGIEHIERQHSRGKMMARERIACLLDEGTFSELGSSVNTTGARIDGRESDAPCDGAVVGTGKIEGRRVVVYASDFTVLGGSIGTQHGLKFVKVMEMAAAWGIPMVWLLDSSGGRLGYQDVPMAGIDWWFALESRFSGMIPQINVLLGPCIAGQAYCPTLCDFLLMSRGTAHLWLGGPRMTQAATSEKIGDDVGGADYHMIYSGTCDVVGEDDAETIQKTRALLGYLPSNWKERPPVRETADPPDREVGELAALVPDDGDHAYDMHDVIKVLVDDGRYYEIKDEYARQLITGFCHFNGQATGLVACNPLAHGSAIEIDACDKYYRFLEVLDAYGIPLVTLVDTPPILPDETQEARGLVRHMGKMLDLFATATIPKISVVLRRAYADAGGIILGCVKDMGVDLAYAWPTARYSVEASAMDYGRPLGAVWKRTPTRGTSTGPGNGWMSLMRPKAGPPRWWMRSFIPKRPENGSSKLSN
ncbi:MAG: carboxyl transferase domain-containing protein [Deltaproteobacteria bacterium]|nr:carboxyl transferase domain-containing protein [Deltaproteobacteria bacterium]